jgi:hypothetical protein
MLKKRSNLGKVVHKQIWSVRSDWPFMEGIQREKVF